MERWDGSVETVYWDQFARLQGNFGVRLEAAPVHPGLFALAVPWDNAQEHKRRMARAAYASVFIALVRDSGEGHVTLNPQGDPILRYWPNALDRAHLVRGLQELARVVAAGGATGIRPPHTPPTPRADEWVPP